MNSMPVIRALQTYDPIEALRCPRKELYLIWRCKVPSRIPSLTLTSARLRQRIQLPKVEGIRNNPAFRVPCSVAMVVFRLVTRGRGPAVTLSAEPNAMGTAVVLLVGGGAPIHRHRHHPQHHVPPQHPPQHPLRHPPKHPPRHRLKHPLRHRPRHRPKHPLRRPPQLRLQHLVIMLRSMKASRFVTIPHLQRGMGGRIQHHRWSTVMKCASFSQSHAGTESTILAMNGALKTTWHVRMHRIINNNVVSCILATRAKTHQNLDVTKDGVTRCVAAFRFVLAAY